jgi:hypothetical protein
VNYNTNGEHQVPASRKALGFSTRYVPPFTYTAGQVGCVYFHKMNTHPLHLDNMINSFTFILVLIYSVENALHHSLDLFFIRTMNFL